MRETKEKAISARKDADTGICRTGLEEYLQVIFPDTNDWIHDKVIDNLPKGIKTRKRPDYRSESLKLIVEFDGLQHYTNPEKIKDDKDTIEFYEKLGYKVVRIPYFIQLTNQAVKELFNVCVKEPLFDGSIPSLGVKGKNTPAYLCVAGIERMAKEFVRFPEQFETNKKALLQVDDEYLTGVNALIRLYDHARQ
ncbi:MAG: DUF559 domain-containing protein [Lachnospiraceae bacterium]|nr:DUF559 domain-containing protein [Lachnospiraceae bacterium]